MCSIYFVTYPKGIDAQGVLHGWLKRSVTVPEQNGDGAASWLLSNDNHQVELAISI
jgi:hypothetical protein